MGSIVISTNTSLDGVVQDPDGQEGSRLGGWFRRTGGDDLEPWGKVMLGDALAADALLLGRRTDDWFASRWNERTGEWADRLSVIPKYVVSSTADEVKWGRGPGTILRGDVVDEVTKLKQQVDGDILMYASYQLARTLLDHDLVDELRLTIFPVVLGDGERLFGASEHATSLRLADTMTIGDGLTYVTYEVVRDS
jgi:dihydrofolate reductase